MTSVAFPAERRSHRRFALQTPLRYREANGPLNAAWKNGSMLNMSATGIFIEVADSLMVGTKLELSMEWTGLYHGRQTMRLFLIASVLRTGLQGVALRILGHRFRDLSSPRVRIQRTEKKLAVA